MTPTGKELTEIYAVPVDLALATALAELVRKDRQGPVKLPRPIDLADDLGITVGQLNATLHRLQDDPRRVFRFGPNGTVELDQDALDKALRASRRPPISSPIRKRPIAQDDETEAA